MNAFLRAVEAQRLREREVHLCITPGSQIPGETPGNPGRSANEQLRESILRTTHQHPEWTPVEIAEELRCAAITVRKIQRQAGVYREPIRRDGRLVMP